MNREEKQSPQRMETSHLPPNTADEASARQIGESTSWNSSESHLEINGDIVGSGSKTETV